MKSITPKPKFGEESQLNNLINLYKNYKYEDVEKLAFSMLSEIKI